MAAVKKVSKPPLFGHKEFAIIAILVVASIVIVGFVKAVGSFGHRAVQGTVSMAPGSSPLPPMVGYENYDASYSARGSVVADSAASTVPIVRKVTKSAN